jgi:hypothetical protein
VPVVCGCATWSVTVREELRLRMSENFGQYMELRGYLGKLCNGKCRDLYCLQNCWDFEMRWEVQDRACSLRRGKGNVYRIWCVQCEGAAWKCRCFVEEVLRV